ncbi:DUF421 domain-containing protein [Thalassoroseus pseudoceratinae]|uniref:DUF421 domain-containing protein n=1 Tax=Thalassoroseus pseudoceratinae TaxID=2713176 RepID=UPI00141DDE6F|nr:YetF domain-containing protein [Thalassoroseus pseudoceratinae]
MNDIFFDNWESLARTTVIGICGYVSLIILLRIAGNRTLTKMNAFDLIVTIALGSTLATLLLSKDVPLAQGVLGLALLIGFQFIITWVSVRAPWVRRVVTGEPSLLLYRGECIDSSLRKSRVVREEVESAIRGAGLAELKDAAAVILETDGSVSVIPNGSSNIQDIAGIDVSDAIT